MASQDLVRFAKCIAVGPAVECAAGAASEGSATAPDGTRVTVSYYNRDFGSKMRYFRAYTEPGHRFFHGENLP